MRWEAEWWGIILTAEDEKDEKMLKELQAKLPKELDWPPHQPTIKESIDEETGKFQLKFDHS